MKKIWFVSLGILGIYPVDSMTPEGAIEKAIKYLINKEPRVNVKKLREDQNEGRFSAIEREVIE